MRALAVLTILGMALLLAGCGYYHWQKQGASNADFQADQAACQQSGATGFAFNNCMLGRGWSYVN